MTQQLQSGGAVPGENGRSTLLRAGRASLSRPRRFWRRRLILSVVGGALVLLIVAVASEFFATDGPAALLYWLHDNVWLPLNGRFWTSVFPLGLIWLLPVGMIFTLVMVEYSGLAAPVRFLQVHTLMWLLRGRGFVPVLLWHRLLGLAGLRAALAEAILRDEQNRLCGDVVQSLGRNEPPGNAFAQLVEIQRKLMDFGLHNEADVAAILETLAIARFSRDADLAALRTLGKHADQECPRIYQDWRALRDAIRNPPDVTECMRHAAALGGTDEPALSLAGRTIAIALGAVSDRHKERLAWFDEWARLRAGDDAGLAGKLGLAESLCAFEFWAAQTELAAAEQRPDEIFSVAFKGLALVRPRGEVFAQDGNLGGSEAPR